MQCRKGVVMTVRNDMLRQLRSRRPGFTLGRDFYTDPAFYELDLELVYYRDWLFIGHDCELPKTGSYLTAQIGAYPILVVRDTAGRVRAFHNSCRHRGSRICSAPKGTAAKLVCPYHQWTYELDGRLLFARDMAAGFDPAEFGLKPIHCESLAGYIFICLAPSAPDFAPMRSEIERYLAPHRLSEAKVAFETTIVENGNWKLVWENNRECYHCAGSHPELCRTFPEAPTVTDVKGALGDPAIVAHWQRCEALGLPSAMHLAESGQYRTARMPLLANTVSATLSGKAAVRRPLCDDISEPNIGTMLLFHYPTTWNHVFGDHAISFRVLPISPMETQLTTKWLVHRDAVEGVDYDLKTLTEVWLATNDQDRRIVEENQFGIRSPAYEPGPYSAIHEGGTSQFVDWYCRLVEQRLGGDAVKLTRVA
jgi:glycine betaine catabolism A